MWSRQSPARLRHCNQPYSAWAVWRRPLRVPETSYVALAACASRLLGLADWASEHPPVRVKLPDTPSVQPVPSCSFVQFNTTLKRAGVPETVDVPENVSVPAEALK